MTCFVGLKPLTEICQLSKNTVRKTLETLEAKGHIKRLERFNGNGRKGTLYRVFLPCEIPGLVSKTTFRLIAK
jgi:predicted ArsR family transcriptional regulator